MTKFFTTSFKLVIYAIRAIWMSRKGEHEDPS
jgi:hypothetical protein